MSDVRKVTIEPMARASETTHHISATVNVGGSLVNVSFDSEQDPELHRLVRELDAKLASLAVGAVQQSMQASDRQSE